MLVVPFLKTEGQLIKMALSGNDPREKSAAEHLQAIILVSTCIKNRSATVSRINDLTLSCGSYRLYFTNNHQDLSKVVFPIS